jgi:hypothetical protein
MEESTGSSSQQSWVSLIDSIAKSKRRKKNKNPTRKLRAPVSEDPKEIVTIPLRAAHYIDGVRIGPGWVKVTQEMARQLQHADGLAVAYDESFMAAKNGIAPDRIVVGARGNVGGTQYRAPYLPQGYLDGADSLPEIGVVDPTGTGFSVFHT